VAFILKNAGFSEKGRERLQGTVYDVSNHAGMQEKWIPYASYTAVVNFVRTWLPPPVYNADLMSTFWEYL
jgi:hypothetical protein